jgi:hypothetical protein
MTHINKKLFFLSFLLMSFALHCMEKNNTEFTLNLPNNRIELASKLVEDYDPLIYPFYCENHGFALGHYSKIEPFKEANFNGYSFLGFAAIAIKVYPSKAFKADTTKYPEYAPYADRKNLIMALRERGWKPTRKDRELALIVEKEENIISFNDRSDLFD